jgi:hypothetical protein
MENALVFLTFAVFVLFWQLAKTKVACGSIKKAVWCGLGLTAGVFPFVRPELTLFSIGFIGYLLLMSQPKSPKFMLGSTYILTLIFFALLTWLTFRSLIPQTAEAKALFLRQADPFYGLFKTLKVIVSGSFGCFLVILTTKPETRAVDVWRVVTIIVLVVIVGYLSYVNQIISSRYASYLNLPTVIAAVLVVADRSSGDRSPTAWMKLCLGTQFVLSLVVLNAVFPVTRISEAAEIKKVADFVVVNSAPTARIAISEIGAFGFYSKKYIIDMFGLTDRATLAWHRQNGRLQSREQFEEFLTARQADYYIDTSATDKPLNGKQLRFQPIGEFSVKRNIFFQGSFMFDRWRVYKIHHI